jgi:hypothetical protein
MLRPGDAMGLQNSVLGGWHGMLPAYKFLASRANQVMKKMHKSQE